MEKVYLFLHVAGALLFLGNIVTTAFWKLQWDRSGDPKELHRMAATVMRADYWLTIPGLLLLVVFGVLTAHAYGYSFAELNWLTVSLLLFALSGALWAAVLLPCQRRMIRLSEEGVRSGKMPEPYAAVSRRWNVWGTVNTIIPVVILFLMVVKP